MSAEQIYTLIVLELLVYDDRATPRSRILGCLDGELVLVKEEPEEGTWHRICRLSHIDIDSGPHSFAWNLICEHIRSLLRKGVLK